MTEIVEVGPAGQIPDEVVLGATRAVRTGKRYSLAVPRFPGMPLFPGHPQFQVLSYRTPRGIAVAGDEPWGPINEAGLGYMSELIIGSAHTGAHIDALAHMTLGAEGRWFGGGSADEHLSDFGPRVGDASKLPSIVARGVLLDVAAAKGVKALPKGYAIGAEELQAVADGQGVEIGKWDVVLIRTGYMAHWPDAGKLGEHLGAGPDLSAARWLSERGVIATGTDTDTYEVQPAPDPGTPANPQPVHTHLLIERGIYLFESLHLEELAAAQAYQFLFVALPLKISGATGSMVDPVAIV